MNEEQILQLMIVDDHQMLIDGLKSMLRKEKSIQIVAMANNGLEALKILRSGAEINFIITDINMPEISGTELAKIVKTEFPEIKILVLSMFNDSAIVSEIMNVEAEGYILKNAGKQELISAIYKIANNGTYYSSEVISELMKDFKQTKIITENNKSLSQREIEILKLIVQENTTNQIAEKLFISPRTVDTHRKNILQKTNTKTLVGLIKFAFENKLTD
jgi:DNA-binding NarL/FixJ family response regulator